MMNTASINVTGSTTELAAALELQTVLIESGEVMLSA